MVDIDTTANADLETEDVEVTASVEVDAETEPVSEEAPEETAVEEETVEEEPALEEEEDEPVVEEAPPEKSEDAPSATEAPETVTSVSGKVVMHVREGKAGVIADVARSYLKREGSSANVSVHGEARVEVTGSVPETFVPFMDRYEYVLRFN